MERDDKGWKRSKIVKIQVLVIQRGLKEASSCVNSLDFHPKPRPNPPKTTTNPPKPFPENAPAEVAQKKL